MSTDIRRTLTAVGLSLAVATGTAALSVPFTATQAVAGNHDDGERGNGGGRGNGGNGGGRGASDDNRGNGGNPNPDRGRPDDDAGSAAKGRDNGSNGRGALASELRGLNAAHASPTALANAAPDSMPGRLNTYREAAEETQETRDELLTAIDDYFATYGVQPQDYDGKTAGELADELDALAGQQGTNSAEYEALQAQYEQALAAERVDALYEQAETLAAGEEEAFTELTGDRELSEEALAELHSLLGMN